MTDSGDACLHWLCRPRVLGTRECSASHNDLDYRGIYPLISSAHTSTAQSLPRQPPLLHLKYPIFSPDLEFSIPLLSTFCLLPSIHYLLSATQILLFALYYLLFTIHYILFAICYLSAIHLPSTTLPTYSQSNVTCHTSGLHTEPPTSFPSSSCVLRLSTRIFYLHLRILSAELSFTLRIHAKNGEWIILGSEILPTYCLPPV